MERPVTTKRTGGRYVRDPQTKSITHVEGPALRAAEAKAQAEAEATQKAKAKAKSQTAETKE